MGKKSAFCLSAKRQATTVVKTIARTAVDQKQEKDKTRQSEKMVNGLQEKELIAQALLTLASMADSQKKVQGRRLVLDDECCCCSAMRIMEMLAEASEVTIAMEQGEGVVIAKVECVECTKSPQGDKRLTLELSGKMKTKSVSPTETEMKFGLA